MLMVHHFIIVKSMLVLCTAALAVISETAVHMNSTIVDLVNPIVTLFLCIDTENHNCTHVH